MKRLFFNEEGKLSISNVLILLLVITIIGLTLLDIKLFNDRSVKKTFDSITTTTATTKFIYCKDCSMSFKNNLELTTNNKYDLEDLITYDKIGPVSAKYTVDNKDLAKVFSDKKKMYLSTNDKVGKIKLEVSYGDIVITKELNIVEGKILSAKLPDYPYYVYLGQANSIEVNTNPKGVDISKLDLAIENPEIAEFKNGKIIGKQVGETKITLKFDEETYETELVVVKDKINIEYKGEEVFEVFTSKVGKEFDIILTLDDKDKAGYTKDNVIIEHIDEGINAYVNYNNQNMEKERSYNYKIVLENIEENGKSTVIFKLSDGTRRKLYIYNK